MLVLGIASASAQTIESFEATAIPSAYVSTGGSLSLDSSRYRMDKKALRFDWGLPAAELTVSKNIPSLGSTKGFAAWIYLSTAMPGKQIIFQFLRSGTLRRQFAVNANFTGWQSVLVNFNTHTTLVSASNSFDKWKIVMPSTVPSGSMWLDGVFFSDASAPDQLAGDRQLPFVNPAQDDHWAPLPNDNLSPPAGFPGSLANAAELQGLARLRSFHDYVPIGSLSEIAYNTRMAAYQAWSITRDATGIRGVPVFFNNDNYTDASVGDSMPLNLSNICQDMLAIAQSCRIAEKAGQTYYVNGLRAAFLDLYDHLRDQGFTAGCSLGTIHHHGYSTRFWAEAIYYMRETLISKGLLADAEETMAWFFNRKRIFEDSSILGASADDLNTTIEGRLMSILMMGDEHLAVAYLREFKSKLDRALTHSYQSIKADGSLWHHGGFYTGYGVPALNGVSNITSSLASTPFRISPEAHALLRKAVLLMRVYGNKTQFAPTITGRHPEGTSALSATCLYNMAKSGTPEGREQIDREVAAAFMRLSDSSNSGYQEFATLGISPEAAPTGTWNVPYGCFQVQRRDGWMALIKGHNKWNFHTETYATEHRFGRNMAHGSIFLLNAGNPFNNLDSGYDESAGWDWRHIPGTTAVYNKTIAEMRETGSSIRGYTSYQAIGGHSHKNRHGVFLMRIEGGADNRDDVSLRATKSYFMFDNRIICLGSGVTFTDTSEEIHTILYQKKLATTSTPTHVSGTQVTEFPYSANMGPGPVTLVDPIGVGYYLPDGVKVNVRRQSQQSRDNQDAVDTFGNYASAWINHGSVPSGGKYEYAMVVGADNAAMQTFASKMSTVGSEPYTVISNETEKIIVNDRSTGITAYVFPLAAYTATDANESLQALNKPGIVTLEPQGSTTLDISVTDPNINVDPTDLNVSIAGRMQVTLKGIWMTRTPSLNYRVLSRNATTTVIEVNTQHGESVNIPLQAAEVSPPAVPFSGFTPNTLALWHFDTNEVYTNGSGRSAVNEARAGGPGDAHAIPYGVELSGAASGFTKSGKFDGCHFNINSGVSDGATVIDGSKLFPSATDPDLTVECWVKFDDLGGTQMLVDKCFGFNDIDGYRLYWASDRFHWHLGDGTVRMALEAAPTLQVGTWYHVAATWDAIDDTSRIYLNGAVIASQQFVGKSIVNSGQGLRIAQRNVSTWVPLRGMIDEVRISASAYDYAAGSPRFNTESLDLGNIEEESKRVHNLSSSLESIALGSTAIYSLIDAPTFANIDSISGQLQLSPQLGNTGPGSFVVRVVDDLGKIAEITVKYQVTASTLVRWADAYSGNEPNTIGLWHFDEREVYLHSNSRPTVNEARSGDGEANSNPNATHAYGGAVFAAGGFRGWALHLPGGQSSADRSQVVGGAGMFPTASDPSLTVECWVKFNTLNPGYNQFIIDKQWSYSQPSGYRLLLNNSSPQRFVWYLGDGTSAMTLTSSAATLKAGQWHHVAATWDAATDTSRIFLDSVPIGEAVFMGKRIVNSIHELRFGQRNVSTFGAIDGAIDEVRISDIARPFTFYTTPVTDAYSMWLVRHFSPAEVRVGLANAAMDTDGDGILNGAEYLLLFDPRNPHDPRAPVSRIIEDRGLRYPSLTYTRSTMATGPSLRLMKSTDLVTWSPADSEMIIVGAPSANGDGSETLTVRHTNPVSGKLFFRVVGSK